jgi:ubiquinone/menaquinone biosynthesis C-methylase UbiE
MSVRTFLFKHRRWLLVAIALFAIHLALHWPKDSDRSAQAWMARAATEFYTQAYSKEDELKYQQVAADAAEQFGIQGHIGDFVRKYKLERAHVLDVGAGRGYLQDAVEDYTGLDISPSARRFFHKPYVEASATKMPFRDGEFDAAWSIWVIEHVPEPQQVFSEMRRVVKPGGYLYLFPAWNTDSWAAEGYQVRPYSDFNWTGKLTKASLAFRDTRYFKASYRLPIRALKLLGSVASSGPTELAYRRLTPNFSHYWTNDSDAVTDLDRYDAKLWFTSRGDECLNCGLLHDLASRQDEPLIIRVTGPR